MDRFKVDDDAYQDECAEEEQEDVAGDKGRGEDLGAQQLVEMAGGEAKVDDRVVAGEVAGRLRSGRRGSSQARGDQKEGETEEQRDGGARSS